MFDTVGGRLEADTWRRDLTSAALLLALATCSAVTVVAIGGLHGDPAPAAPPIDLGDVFEPYFAPEPGPSQAPAAPGPVISCPEGDAAKGAAASDEAPETPKDLAPLLPTPVVDAAPIGTEDGDTDGVATNTKGDGTGPGGGGGGTNGGGGCTGDDCGDGRGGGAVRVSSEEAQLRSKVEPIYPASGHGLVEGDVVCTVDVTIDPSGRPRALDVRGCPTPFVASTEAALFRWRWYPVKAFGREPVEAVFRVRVVYREP